MWCPWYGERIILGLVTPGGIVYHAACWRRRADLLRNADRQADGTMLYASPPTSPR